MNAPKHVSATAALRLSTVDELRNGLEEAASSAFAQLTTGVR
ncbi:MAG: hypothetical protein ABI421_02530 [Polyangiaceae bacterium]